MKEEELYTMGWSLYERGDYAQAADFFTQLVLLSPFSEAYWKGLASSRQMMEEYQAALHAWSLVCLLLEHDPLPHFHAAECLLSLKEKKEALKALDSALSKCLDGPLRIKIETLKKIHYGND